MITLFTLQNLLAWSMQVALLVAAALTALRMLRLDVPAVHYGVLRLVLAACLVLPLAGRFAGGSNAQAGGVDAAIQSTWAMSAEESGTSPGSLTAFAEVHGATAVAALLMVGALARLVLIAAGMLRLRRLRGAGEVALPSEEADRLQRTIGTRAAIRYVSGLGQPVTFGIRRPVVLLPQSLLAQHPAIQRAVLAHELWHVRRRDWMWAVAEEGLRALFWFHPAIWILLSRIQHVREEVVDELTILTTGSRRGYVDALLAFADASPVFAATAFARRRHLVHRLMLISREAVMSARRVVACCAVVAMSVLAAGWYSVQAFPIVGGQVTGDLARGPGPVEKSARPITPENPIPRRTFHVEPDYPAEAEAAQARGTVTVRLAIDQSGQVAETRVTGMALRMRDSVTISFRDVTRTDVSRMLSDPGGLGAGREWARAAAEALASAAAGAVARWQYAPPAEGPLAFSVTLPVGGKLQGDVPPPPPPPPAPPAPPRPVVGLGEAVPGDGWDAAAGAVRVGGTIKAPTKTRHVNPVYPQEARDAGVAGVVIIEARIEPDGTVGASRILRSIPLLDEAAMDAVEQWTFTPTLLNGNPVPVIMTVTINFTLQ